MQNPCSLFSDSLGDVPWVFGSGGTWEGLIPPTRDGGGSLVARTPRTLRVSFSVFSIYCHRPSLGLFGIWLFGLEICPGDCNPYVPLAEPKVTVACSEKLMKAQILVTMSSRFSGVLGNLGSCRGHLYTKPTGVPAGLTISWPPTPSAVGPVCYSSRSALAMKQDG